MHANPLRPVVLLTVALFALAVGASAQSFRELCDEAASRLAAGDGVAALPIVRRAIALEPERGEGHLLAAKVLVELGEAEAAQQSAQQALRWLDAARAHLDADRAAAEQLMSRLGSRKPAEAPPAAPPANPPAATADQQRAAAAAAAKFQANPSQVAEGEQAADLLDGLGQPDDADRLRRQLLASKDSAAARRAARKLADRVLGAKAGSATGTTASDNDQAAADTSKAIEGVDPVGAAEIESRRARSTNPATAAAGEQRCDELVSRVGDAFEQAVRNGDQEEIHRCLSLANNSLVDHPSGATPPAADAGSTALRFSAELLRRFAQIALRLAADARGKKGREAQLAKQREARARGALVDHFPAEDLVATFEKSSSDPDQAVAGAAWTMLADLALRLADEAEAALRRGDAAAARRKHEAALRLAALVDHRPDPRGAAAAYRQLANSSDPTIAKQAQDKLTTAAAAARAKLATNRSAVQRALDENNASEAFHLLDSILGVLPENDGSSVARQYLLAGTPERAIVALRLALEGWLTTTATDPSATAPIAGAATEATATDTSAAAGLNDQPRPGQTLTMPFGLDLVFVAPGTFQMGSPSSEPGRRDDETAHAVTITRGFWLAKTRLTYGQWHALVPDQKPFDRPADDVHCESWNAFCGLCAVLTETARRAQRLPEGYRFDLPTEAEWEYACRAGGSGAAGSSPNPWGLVGMQGQPGEWCRDSCLWDGLVDTYRPGILDPLSESRDSPARLVRGIGRAAQRSCDVPTSTGHSLRLALVRRP